MSTDKDNNEIVQPSNAVEQLLAEVRETLQSARDDINSEYGANIDEMFNMMPQLDRLARIVEVQQQALNYYQNRKIYYLTQEDIRKYIEPLTPVERDGGKVADEALDRADKIARGDETV